MIIVMKQTADLIIDANPEEGLQLLTNSILCETNSENIYLILDNDQEKNSNPA